MTSVLFKFDGLLTDFLQHVRFFTTVVYIGDYRKTALHFLRYDVIFYLLYIYSTHARKNEIYLTIIPLLATVLQCHKIFHLLNYKVEQEYP